MREKDEAGLRDVKARALLAKRPGADAGSYSRAKQAACDAMSAQMRLCVKNHGVAWEPPQR